MRFLNFKEALKPTLFFGYNLINYKNQKFFKIASLEKSILDYFYLNPQIKTYDDYQNFNYLKSKIQIENIADLKNKLLLRCKLLDFKLLAKDVEPLLIHSDESKKILLFRDFIVQI